MYVSTCSYCECKGMQFCAGTSPKVETFWHLVLKKGSLAKISFSEPSWRQMGISATTFNVLTIVLIWHCVCVCLVCPQMLLEVVAKTLKQHGISAEHECFEACSKRLFDISKFYLKVSLFTAHTQSAPSSLSLFVCFHASRFCTAMFGPYVVFCHRSSQQISTIITAVWRHLLLYELLFLLLPTLSSISSCAAL